HPLMNITRSVGLILASVFSCHGEIFISSTNQVSSLTISSNETLLISTALHSTTVSISQSSISFQTPEIEAYITIAGVDLPFRFGPSLSIIGPHAIAGPAELKFNLNTTNLVLISFDRVQG